MTKLQKIWFISKFIILICLVCWNIILAAQLFHLTNRNERTAEARFERAYWTYANEIYPIIDNLTYEDLTTLDVGGRPKRIPALLGMEMMDNGPAVLANWSSRVLSPLYKGHYCCLKKFLEVLLAKTGYIVLPENCESNFLFSMGEDRFQKFEGRDLYDLYLEVIEQNRRAKSLLDAELAEGSSYTKAFTCAEPYFESVIEEFVGI